MREQREAKNMAQRGIGVPARPVPVNFKDLVETTAEEHNTVFMPVIGKRQEGKQLSLARYIYQVTRLELFY